MTKIVLDKNALKELFKEYSTPALISEVRQEVSKQLKELVQEEIKKKINKALSDKVVEDSTSEALISFFNNRWSHEQCKPTPEMEEIVLKEFKAKAKNVNFDEIEKVVLEQCQEMILDKINCYSSILKVWRETNSKVYKFKKPKEGLGELFG